MKHDLHLNMLRFFSELYAFFLYHFTKAYISQVRKKRHRKFLRCLYPGHWKRKQQHTPGFLFGKSHAQRNLAGYSPWGHKVSDVTEQLNNSKPSSDAWLATDPGLMPHFPGTALPCFHLGTTLSFYRLPSQKAELQLFATLLRLVNTGAIAQLKIIPLIFSTPSHPNKGLPPTVLDDTIPCRCLGELNQLRTSGSSSADQILCLNNLELH